MNKKLLFLAGLAPLVAAPALVVALCSTSDSTNNGGTNEKKDELNSKKLLVGFRRNSSSTNPIPVTVNGLIKAELKDKKLDEYLTKDAQAIIHEVKDQILVKSGSSKGDTTEKSKILQQNQNHFNEMFLE